MIVTILVNVFTVFAGFLIAIIAVVGDPKMVKDGSWRIAEGGRQRMEQRLGSHVVLFMLYLITIAIIFIAVVIEKAIPENPSVIIWIERAFLFFGVTSFLFTLTLPSMLAKMQSERYDAEIERRRDKEGITD